jgi:adenosylmethionine-8-amino-7-oxononanoate aminotransferase
MHKLARLDHKYVWHPFTQMRDWLRREPIVITSGRGALLRDVHGREYLDANSSIWTNLHGHAHPKINAAIRRQLGKIAHSSALGFANEPASLLAERLVKAAKLSSSKAFRGVIPLPPSNPKYKIRNPQLTKVFFSDDGSTALEVALKLAYVFARRSGRRRPKFLSLDGAYHGDTVGAVGLGHIDVFHKAYSGLLFKTDRVMAPYCYRCPFNRARPDRADARDYRKCNHECIGLVEKKFTAAKRKGNPYAALVVEPLMQGAAGMIPQPVGWLRRAAEIARAHGAQLVADEVMTGFGRTGGPGLFASHQEGVQPDFLAVAKGLTGGYLPMAATLTTPAVFDAFLGDYTEFKTFFHGHSFTGNQLGSAAALASLDLLQSPASLRARQKLQRVLHEELQSLWALPNVGDIRQAGLVAGVELVRNWRTRRPFDLREQAGIRVCEAMARHGVLTRPVGNVIVLMPPYCTTPAQIARIVRVLSQSIRETFSGTFKATLVTGIGTKSATFMA